MRRRREDWRRRKKRWRRRRRSKKRWRRKRGKVAARTSALTQSRDEDRDTAATLVGNIFQQQP